jgi:uncharacterized membrane protein
MKKNSTPKQYKILPEDLGAKFTRWIGSPASLGVHTFFFALSFTLGIFGVRWDRVLLVLTTILSLEAIYLSIFIQMSVNRNTKSLRDVEENLDEIQEDVGEIQKDIDEIQEDVDEISEDEKIEEVEENADRLILEKIRADLARLMDDIEKLKK